LRLTHAASQGALESGVFCAIRLSRGAAEVTKARAERIKTDVILTISNVQGYLISLDYIEKMDREENCRAPGSRKVKDKEGNEERKREREIEE